MTRALVVFLGLSVLASAQTANLQNKFLSELANQPSSRIQEALQVSETEAEALLSATREYASGARFIDEALKQATLERRMQVIAGEKVSIAPEVELRARSNRQIEEVADKTMQAIKSRLGDGAYQRLTSFIEAGNGKGEFFPRPKGKGVTVAKNRPKR